MCIRDRLEEDKWLTAFVCDAGLFEFNRVQFGLKGSGNTFVRAMISLRKFTGSFVGDVVVHFHQWKEHLDHLDRFFAVVKKYGLKKCRFAQSQVTDSEKLQVVQEMKPPTTNSLASYDNSNNFGFSPG